MRYLLGMLALLACHRSMAATPQQIFDANRSSVVYLQVRDIAGQKIGESGTGFILSRDGLIATVNHVRPTDETQKMYASIGTRGGPQFELDELGSDEKADVSLWRMRSDKKCLVPVSFNLRIPKEGDQVVVVGFSLKEDVQQKTSKISTAFGQRGYYRTDVDVLDGSSGSPVFDETGDVIALVQGGSRRGTDLKDLIPFSRFAVLLAQFNVMNAMAAAAEGCRNDDRPLELFSASYKNEQLQLNMPKKIEVDGLLRQGQEVSLCIGFMDSTQVPGQIVANLLPSDKPRLTDQKPLNNLLAISIAPFIYTGDVCSLQGGKGDLYRAFAPKGGRYEVQLFKIAPRDFWDRLGARAPLEEHIFIGIGSGTTRN